MKHSAVKTLIFAVCLSLYGTSEVLSDPGSNEPWHIYTVAEYGFAFFYPDCDNVNINDDEKPDSLIEIVRETYGEVPYELENQLRCVEVVCTLPIFRIHVFSNPDSLSREDFAREIQSHSGLFWDKRVVRLIKLDEHEALSVSGPGTGAYEQVTVVYVSHNDYLISLTLLGNEEVNQRFLEGFVFTE